MRLTIESLAKGGDSVAREGGRVVFLDRGAPGDVVEVELVEQKPRFARGVVREIVTAGSSRVDAPCRWAERCGGCPWQSVRVDVQLDAKQQMVERALRGVQVEPIRPSPRELGYRLRATMHARGGKLGYNTRRSHEIVAIDRCLALEPLLDDALIRVRAALPSIGEEGALRATIADDKVTIAIVLGRGADPRVAEACARLIEERVIAGAIVGDAMLGDALIDSGDGFWISAAGFRQANAAQNDVLRALVREGLDVGGASLLELYCGDGNFTRDLVGEASRVVAIEEDAGAVARLRRNVPGATAVCARVEREVQKRAGERWDRVLLDPPRAGAKDAMASIAAMQPARIVYVSCDVATLARDVQAIAGAYAVERVAPVDMMPHTDHVEVVAVLRRR